MRFPVVLFGCGLTLVGLHVDCRGSCRVTHHRRQAHPLPFPSQKKGLAGLGDLAVRESEVGLWTGV